MNVAVIGAGPSGFFVAEEVLKRCPGCEVHMYEKRVAPYGLVRYGVAPDHQLTRRVVKMFERIGDHARFHYYGNVEIGADVDLKAVYETHHAVIVCSGAETPSRPDIPGARLSGAVDALDISRWVNGESETFSGRHLEGVATVVIIGNGNVALDVARILARPSADWVSTDMAPHAMEALIHHRVRRIVVAGRRGPAEASFTEAELEEVVQLPDWQVKSSDTLPFNLRPASVSSEKVIEFVFKHRAESLLGGDKVVGVRFTDTVRGATVEIPAQLVVFATGHRGSMLGDLPFDRERGVISNIRGRVDGRPGYYVCGWIKRGAKGLIGQNRKDAIETVSCLLEDRDLLAARAVTKAVRAPSKPVVSWNDWKKLDAKETQRGSAVGRPRIAYSTTEALRVLAES